MAARVPIVRYLELDPVPHLVAHRCTQCGARFFDRRNGCASCGGCTFDVMPISAYGEVRSFTIVHVAAPGVAVPFVAAVVDCDGTSVRANLIDVPPDPERIRLGMQVRLTTYSLGMDDHGVEAVGFGFAPSPPVGSDRSEGDQGDG